MEPIELTVKYNCTNTMIGYSGELIQTYTEDNTKTDRIKLQAKPAKVSSDGTVFTIVRCLDGVMRHTFVREINETTISYFLGKEHIRVDSCKIKRPEPVLSPKKLHVKTDCMFKTLLCCTPGSIKHLTVEGSIHVCNKNSYKALRSILSELEVLEVTNPETYAIFVENIGITPRYKVMMETCSHRYINKVVCKTSTYHETNLEALRAAESDKPTEEITADTIYVRNTGWIQMEGINNKVSKVKLEQSDHKYTINVRRKQGPKSARF